MRWLARGETELPSDLHWLSAGEREEVEQLRFTKRRTEYLTRRWAAKHAVAAEMAATAGGDGPLPLLPRIEVRHHSSGAPWVAFDDQPVDLDVSLTDRAGWAVCLVRRAAAAGAPTSLGIDLELVEPRSDGFVADFFTPAEQAAVAAAAAVGDDARHLAANLVWSAKEAALKVLRVGLRADTRSVEVAAEPQARPDDWARLVVTATDGTRFPGWWRRDGHFVLTLASLTEGPPPERIAGSTDLATAIPQHRWMDRPVV